MRCIPLRYTPHPGPRTSLERRRTNRNAIPVSTAPAISTDTYILQIDQRFHLDCAQLALRDGLHGTEFTGSILALERDLSECTSPQLLLVHSGRQDLDATSTRVEIRLDRTVSDARLGDFGVQLIPVEAASIGGHFRSGNSKS